MHNATKIRMSTAAAKAEKSGSTSFRKGKQNFGITKKMRARATTKTA